MSADDRAAPRRLDLGLVSHHDEIFASMMRSSYFEHAHGPWLRDRYAEIVPVVLPDALRCIETGAALAESSRAAIRSSAAAVSSADVPLAVVLRGGVPAVRAFGGFMHGHLPALGPGDIAVALGRAALISHELAACWVEVFAADETTVDGENLDLVAVRGDVESPALEMLALAATGHSNEQIAIETDYSVQAVKWHLARVMRTWRVGNRAALVSVAFVRGVLTSRPPPERPRRRG